MNILRLFLVGTYSIAINAFSGPPSFVPSMSKSRCYISQINFQQSKTTESRPFFVSSKITPYKTRTLHALDISDTDAPSAENIEDEDEEEWEYEEFENLTESDFYGSEWKVGTVMDDRGDKINETWCRLVVQDGQNIAIWGDNAKGKWNFDIASQFLSISKETFGGWLGKRIWAGSVDDFYYLQGTVRGWSPLSPASVLGQWQAKRLGVSKEEAGVAPWFQDEELKSLEEAEDNDAEENDI